MEPIVAGAGITIKARTNHNGESLIHKLLGKTQGRGVGREVLPWSASLLPVETLQRTSLVRDTLPPSCGHAGLLLGPHVQSILCWSPFRLVGVVILPPPHFSHKSLTYLFVSLPYSTGNTLSLYHQRPGSYQLRNGGWWTGN